MERSITTTRGERLVDVHGNFDPDDFYKQHRGGSGNVIVVFVYKDGKEYRTGVFGSIEQAQEWAFALDDSFQCIFSPFVVDEPDFGNATKN